MGVKDRNKIVEFKDYIVNKDRYKGNKTIFKSMGIGLEDIAAGYVILKNMFLQPVLFSRTMGVLPIALRMLAFTSSI